MSTLRNLVRFSGGPTPREEYRYKICQPRKRERMMTARAKDHDEIVRVMQLYVDGFNDNDVGKFKEAFHDDAWIFYVDADARLTKNLISENFALWAAPPSWRVVGRIVSVTQVGDVASVQIVWDRNSIPSDVWIDFHNLIKIGKIWKITNKTATHSSRA